MRGADEQDGSPVRYLSPDAIGPATLSRTPQIGYTA